MEISNVFFPLLFYPSNNVMVQTHEQIVVDLYLDRFPTQHVVMNLVISSYQWSLCFHTFFLFNSLYEEFE